MSSDFQNSYLGKLRQVVGSRLLQVPAVRAVLEDSEGRVLLQKRSDFKVWGLPGGHPEERESATDCIRREVREETGLELGEFEPIAYSSSPASEITKYPHGDIVHSYALVVHSKDWKGALAEATDESLELRFFHLDEVPEMLPSERQSLELFMKWKKDRVFRAY